MFILLTNSKDINPKYKLLEILSKLLHII